MEENFSSAEMKFAKKNHPCERIFISRDESTREESSLREIFIGKDESTGEESSLREIFHQQG